FLVVAAEGAAHVGALVLEPALVGGPQHLHHVDRVGPAPDLHRSSLLGLSIAIGPCRPRRAGAAWRWICPRAAAIPPRRSRGCRRPRRASAAGRSSARRRCSPAWS